MMLRFVGIVGFLKIDAQSDPVPALILAAVIGAALWFVVAQSRRREERRSQRQPRDRPRR